MNTYPAIRLILMLVAFILFVAYYTLSISTDIQVLFFVVSLLITGIPHGSLDHLIHAKNICNDELKISNMKRSFFKLYHGILLAYGVLWLLSPSIALILFILFSSYHFGELDWIWVRFKNKFVYSIFSTFYGLMLLLNTVLFHIEEISTNFSNYVTLKQINDLLVTHLLPVKHTLLIWSIVIILVVLFGQLYSRKAVVSAYFTAVFQLFVLFLVLLKLPLLLGFGFYFSYWHSILTISSMLRYLKKKGEPALNILRKGVANSLVATVCIALVVLFSADGLLQHSTLIILAFAGIAILTAPHLVVITQMFDRIHHLKYLNDVKPA